MGKLIDGDFLILFCRNLEDAERKYVQKVVLWGLLGHIVAAYFSSGFHHFDEHFQITEFLSYKLGMTEKGQLAWEFHDQIRPWTQIFFYYLIAAPLHSLGAGPFAVIFALRLATSLIGWLALTSLTPIIKDMIQNAKWRKRTYLLTHFFWFVPYFQARTSSENLSASLFILGFALFYWSPKIKRGLVSGFLLGLSYAVRFQSAIAVAFLWFQELLVGDRQRKTLLYSALGVVAAISLGMAIDSWGYGEFQFTAWNYFYKNIFLGKASEFGVEPWYFYFVESFEKGIPPLSLVMILGTLGYWVLYPKSKLTWATLPFFLIHCFIGHKELRFIFPIIIFTPLMLGKCLEFIEEKKGEKRWLEKSWKVFLSLNLILYTVCLFRAANPSEDFYHFIAEEKVHKLYLERGDPFEMLGLKLTYFRPEKYQALSYKEIPKNEDFYLFAREGRHVLKLREKDFCQLRYITYPTWTLNFNITGWIERSRVWSVFRCTEREKTLDVVSK